MASICYFMFIFILVTSEKPVICKIHIIKKAEKGDGYKRKSAWDLSDLKSVDGKITSAQGLYHSKNVCLVCLFD